MEDHDAGNAARAAEEPPIRVGIVGAGVAGDWVVGEGRVPAALWNGYDTAERLYDDCYGPGPSRRLSLHFPAFGAGARRQALLVRVRSPPVSLTVRIDPHVHSEASYDGTDPSELLLEQAAEIGLDAIVVTDHDVVHESVRAAEMAPKYGLVGIPGVEVSTADGHLLAIGVEEMPPRRASMAETAEWVREHGGIAIVPHPFQRSRHGVSKRRLRGVVPDAIEVYNSWAFTGWKNRRARRYAKAHGYPGVAGSDSHKVGYVGRAYTEIGIDDVAREDLTADVILEAVRDGATRVEGRRTPMPTSARHYSGAGARKSRYYAKHGAVQSGSLAKTGVVEAARTLYRVSPISW